MINLSAMATPERAQVVVIGGGITGCSVAYHLALAGWRDVLLLDKGELTSGSTHHAAGLVTQFNPSATMMRVPALQRLAVRAAGRLPRRRQRPDRVQPRLAGRDLQRAWSRAVALGLEAELIGPDEVLEHLPLRLRGLALRRRLDHG